MGPDKRSRSGCASSIRPHAQQTVMPRLTRPIGSATLGHHEGGRAEALLISEGEKMATRNEVYKEIKETLGLVPKWIEQMPEGAVAGFWGMARDFWLKETVIPNKYKELIGVAISGATRCRYCALFHTEAARLFGASDEEVSEASMMGALSMCGSTFINAQQIDYEQFRQETKSIIAHVKKNL
jgi:AhpD family alkylhydroperoxidase